MADRGVTRTGKDRAGDIVRLLCAPDKFWSPRVKNEVYHGMKRTAVPVVLLIIGFMLSGCSSAPRNQLIGKWEGLSGPGVADRMEFFKDGTLSIVQYGMPLGGEYKLVDKEHVKIIFSGSYVFRFSVSGDVLTLIEENGDIYKYRKI